MASLDWATAAGALGTTTSTTAFGARGVLGALATLGALGAAMAAGAGEEVDTSAVFLVVFFSTGILFVFTTETVEDIFNALVMIVMWGGHVNTFRLDPV